MSRASRKRLRVAEAIDSARDAAWPHTSLWLLRLSPPVPPWWWSAPAAESAAYWIAKRSMNDARPGLLLLDSCVDRHMVEALLKRTPEHSLPVWAPAGPIDFRQLAQHCVVCFSRGIAWRVPLDALHLIECPGTPAPTTAPAVVRLDESVRVRVTAWGEHLVLAEEADRHWGES